MSAEEKILCHPSEPISPALGIDTSGLLPISEDLFVFR